jgi:hypothetical protein
MDDTSVILIITIGTGFLGLIVRYCFRSKCRNINVMWGCMKINREVEIELGDESKKEETKNMV